MNDKLLSKNQVILLYKLNDGLLYQIINNETRFCIPCNLTPKILKIAHEIMHFNFKKALQNLIDISIYKDAKLLKKYIDHYSQCYQNNFKKYFLYDFLQPIFSLFIFFHIVSLDFILKLSKGEYDAILTVINKYTKRLMLIVELFIWGAEQ